MIDPMKRANGTGSKAYLRSDGRWVAKLTLGQRDGRQYQRGFYGATAAIAEAKRDAAARRLGLGLELDDPGLRLRDYLADWLRRCELKLKPSTLRRYRQIVEGDIVPMLGTVPVRQLTPERVEGMLEELTGRLGPRSVFHVRAVLRASLRRAVRRRILTENPASDVEMPVREPDDEQRALTAEEAALLIPALADQRWGCAAIVALTTGLRQGEVLGLVWDDVDVEHRTLHVPGTKTKGSKAPIGLPETTAAALRAWRKRQAAEQLAAGAEWRDRRGLVFTRPDGRPAPATMVLRELQAAATAVGLGHLTFHQLRHTASSILQAEGVDLKTIQRVLRHSTMKMTGHYVHVVDAALIDAADRMDRALSREAK